MEAPYLAGLSLDQLRRYRAGLTAEEDRVSYWRRLVHARLDILQEGARSEEVLTVEQLAKVLGDTGAGRVRRVLMSVRPEEPLPDLPVLSTMWVQEVDPHDEEQVEAAMGLLRDAERQLTDYRRALHARIDEATGELIVRYRADPASALTALGA
ncbi:MAG: hypothetical protein DCC50_05585 [Acidobacteria bacterium]|nr:MAG: hypothetical protein DCC50_05585 [Acidobacteriota bacterium]